MYIMKDIIILLLLPFCFTSCSLQTFFEEPYYYIQKDKVVVFSQEKDSIFSRPLIDDNKQRPPSNFSYKITKDSILNNDSYIIHLQGYNDRNKVKIIEEKFKIINLPNRRKRLEIEIGNKHKKKFKTLLYPKSELDSLNPINLITSGEINTLNDSFIDHIKSNYDLKTLDFDNNAIWEWFNDLVIKEGYNPIGAQPLLHKSINQD